MRAQHDVLYWKHYSQHNIKTKTKIKNEQKVWNKKSMCEHRTNETKFNSIRWHCLDAKQWIAFFSLYGVSSI